MEIYVDQTIEVYCKGEFDVDLEDFCDFLDGEEPSIDALENYLEHDLDIECTPPGDTIIEDMCINSLEISKYDELFEEVKRIQNERAS